MLKTILSISGKPGLYKLVSQSKNMLIAESLLTNKKTPVYSHEKVISLGDIAMFTDEGETPLGDVLEAVRVKENGAVATTSPKADPETLRAYFAEVLPNFDRERVYPSDIKKLLTWYNLLVENNLTDIFVTKEEASAEEEA